MMMKTDKSVRRMGWRSFDPLSPRIEMRGYHGFMNNLFLIPHVETWGYSRHHDNRVQVNPTIHRWEYATYTHSPLSVLSDYSYLKTDESVGMAWGVSFDPRVKMRGYPELVDNRVQINLLIHQWEYATYTHSPLSVSTDYNRRDL